MPLFIFISDIKIILQYITRNFNLKIKTFFMTFYLLSNKKQVVKQKNFTGPCDI